MAQRTTQPMRQQMEKYIFALQDEIVSTFEALDPNSPPFKRDSWIRPEGGSGRSCIFANPPSDDGSDTPHQSVLEKAGVNISLIHGTTSPPGTCIISHALSSSFARLLLLRDAIFYPSDTGYTSYQA
ncbi:hypothetical protein B0H11DRAFT_2383053 [Mycena galericulata]|nr:hypothetical protein B0H11DRAFT_2383053 [Mycena galericulata]